MIFTAITLNAYPQVPVIRYSTPQVYQPNSAINPLTPVNTGGVVPPGTYDYVSTYAGIHHVGFANGTLTTASFNQPRDATVDLSGNVYIIDDNNVIRKVSPSGVVTTFAGTGVVGHTDGPGSSATFAYPLGIITDASGNVYVTDSNNNMIRKITPDGIVSTLAGSGVVGAADGSGSTASFHAPMGIGIDAFGNLYVADMFNNMIRKITPAGIVSTVAGNGSYGSSNGIGAVASFTQPEDVTIDAVGNMFVADAGNNEIRKITPAGMVSTLAGSGAVGKSDGTGSAASFKFPCAITYCAGNLYVADASNQIIRKVTPVGVVTTIAGAANGSYGDVDGIGRAAQFSYPYGLGTDGSSIYIADNQNSDIRKLSLTGYTISPGLPAGLVFDPTTGIISGTPTVLSPPTDYLVTAYNSDGSGTTIVNIAVANLLQPTIIFLQPVDKTYGDVDFSAAATSTNSTVPLTYLSNDPTVATITSIGEIHITGVGTCTITISQPGNTVYNSAGPISQTLTVNPAALVITADDQTKVYGQPDPVLTFSTKGFVYGETPANLISQPVVTTTATSLSDPGDYTILVTQAQAKNYNITYVPGILTITKAPQVITFNPLPSKTISDANFLLTAISNSGLPITFSSSNPAIAQIINGNEVTMLKVGTVIITASQPGNIDYEAAIVQQNLIILSLTVVIPNAFTPNHDGINDTWEIVGIENDATTVMNVFNRYGKLIYHNKGYYQPWNGCYDGKSLPSGTYYYVLTLKNNTQKFSGPITIIY
ncbi:T9SS type B sorting domain-containing protein [Mucilaginibacter sp.]